MGYEKAMGYKVTWQNVFDQKSGVIWRHISAIKLAAFTAGYPYFLWNDRVYNTQSEEDTGWLRSDVG